MHRVLAFTLIELLVVITIIVVLLALLTPALDRALNAAELATCAARQGTLVRIFNLYAMEEGKRNYLSGVRDDGNEYTAFVSYDFVRVIEEYAGNNRSPRFQDATVTVGTVPWILIDPSYKDFGYRYFTGGWVIGYQYIGGKPYLTQLHKDRPGYRPWRSPMSLRQQGPGEILTGWTTWRDGGQSHVAHTKAGGPAGEDAADGTAYHYQGPGHGEDVRVIAAGANVGRTDGSVSWWEIEDLEVYFAGDQTWHSRW